MRDKAVEILFKKEYELISRRIQGYLLGYRQNIAILGRPYTGKSFLIYHLLQRLPEDICSVVVNAKHSDPLYINRAFIVGLLTSYLGRAICESIELRDLLDANRKKLPQTTAVIERILKKGSCSLVELCGVVERFVEESGRKLVFVIEHLEHLNSLWGDDIFDILAVWVMRLKDVMFVVSSSSVKRARQILQGPLSLLFGNFEEIYLDSVSPSNCRQFFSEVLPQIPARLQKFLFTFTGGSPFYIDILVRALRQKMNSSVDPWEAVVEVIEEQVCSEYGIIYQHFLRFIGTLTDGPYGPQVPSFLLATVGRQDLDRIVDEFGWQRDVLLHKVDVLQERGILRKDHNRLLFEDPLFQFWMSYVYRMKIEGAIVSSNWSRDYAVRCVKERLAKFVEEDTTGDEVKVVELFKRSKDEFVVLPNGNKRRFYRFLSVEIIDSILHIYRAVSSSSYIWLFSYRESWTEKDIFDFIDRTDREKWHRRIIVSKDEITSPVKVVAKESDVWIWDYYLINFLLKRHNLGEIIW